MIMEGADLHGRRAKLDQRRHHSGLQLRLVVVFHRPERVCRPAGAHRLLLIVEDPAYELWLVHRRSQYWRCVPEFGDGTFETAGGTGMRTAASGRWENRRRAGLAIQGATVLARC